MAIGIYVNFILFHSILHEYSSAIPYLAKSIAINGMLYGTDSEEIAHEYQKLASLHFNTGNLQHAAKYARKVLNAYKLHYGHGDKKYHPPGTEEMRRIEDICHQYVK